MNSSLITLSFLLAIMQVAFSAHAQVSFGAKATVGNGNLRIEYDGFDEVISADNIAGFNIGAAVNIDLTGWYIRPEALYLFRKGQVQTASSGNITLHRLQFPVMGGFRVIGPAYIEAGPVYSRLLAIDHDMEASISVHKNGFGYKIGPMVHLGQIMLLANYEGLILSSGSGSRFQEPYRINAGVILFLGAQRLN